MTEERCIYCTKQGNEDVDMLECNNDFSSAYIDLDENSIKFDNSDGTRLYGEFKIKYCPICGRKLEK